MRCAAEASENRSAVSDSVTLSMEDAVRGILRAKILEWVSFSRGMFLTQGSNAGLPHCR